MQYQNSFNFNNNQNKNPFSFLISLLMFAGVIVLIYFILKGFTTLLYLAAPILLIATLIINYRLVADYIVGIFETFQTNVLMGMVKVIFTFFCFPFIIGWLFVKALFYKKMDNVKKQFENTQNTIPTDQFTTYEEVSSKVNNTEPEKPFILDLPKPKEKEKKNPYDNLFDAE